MKLKDNVKMTGIGIFDGKLSLIISERTGFMWFVEIFKDKKGSYIKFNSKYIDSTEKKRGRKIYIRGVMNKWEIIMIKKVLVEEQPQR